MNSSSASKRKAGEISSDDSSSDSEEVELLQDESECDEECVMWDNDCKVVHIPIMWETLYGFHLMPTCQPYPAPPLKEFAPKVSSELKNQTFMQEFKLKWQMEETLKNYKVEIITYPWKVCVIHGLLEDETLLSQLCQEFYEIFWNRRQMDLYDFHQSVDLKYIQLQCINSLYNFLKHDVMPWVGDLMSVQLSKISATCSFYTDTDYLLVHDDQQEDRVVAFVLYLSDIKHWENSWGGALQLFDRDNNEQPHRPKRNIYPKHNQLVLFPVCSISYHQVMEVTTKNFSRLSINGWFHGKVPSTTIIPKYRPPTVGLYSENFVTSVSLGIDLNSWINPNYLKLDTVSQIHEQIEELSEISLVNFFQETKFADVLDGLRCEENQWKFVEPPNRLRYEVLEEEHIPFAVSEFINLFKSTEMFELLHKYTELDINQNGAQLKYELQRWSSGCYSLLSDYEWNKKQELDIVIYLGCQGVVGGQMQYVSQEEEIQQALITLQPQDNVLNLIFRDTARIMCYVSKHTCCAFYVLLCSYAEVVKT